MYKVRVSFTIYSCPAGDPMNNMDRNGQVPSIWAWTEKTIELPFPPFLGLRIESAHDSGLPIIGVTWVNALDGDRYFKCLLENQYPRGDIDYKFLKKHAVEQEYVVKEVGLDQHVRLWAEPLFT